MKLLIIVALSFIIPNSISKVEDIDYGNLNHWAAHPNKEDLADISPSNDVTDMQNKAEVDVFFIHPTTFIQRTKFNKWNADIDDDVVNNRTDELSIKNQASVFSGSTRVFAPRYRQAHLKAFMKEDSRRSLRALNLAYSDVKNAFEEYLKTWNNDRPIIIASHSQGTRHSQRLIKDYFDGQELSNRLVAAYLVGGYVLKDAFDDISICSSSDQVQCFTAWRSYGEDFTPKKRDKISDKYAVVNPINWTIDIEAPADQNLGTYTGLEKLPFIKGKIGARVSKNQVITDPSAIRKIAKEGNLHNYDYNLFYLNIRENVATRVASFLAKE